MARPILAEKDFLNPGEAIQYWNFSPRKFYCFLKECGEQNFRALYGERVLIIRAEMDRFLEEHPDVKERLANGRGRRKKEKA